MAAEKKPEKADGFCDTCESFVESPSRGKDLGGTCMLNPIPYPVKMADMHWCKTGYKKGKQRNARCSSSNPEGIINTTPSEVKDELTIKKPNIPELI